MNSPSPAADAFSAAIEKAIPATLLARDAELGRFILHAARCYSLKVGGRPEGFRELVIDCIFNREKVRLINEVVQYLQTIFMPNYEERLFEYYQSAQYLLLLGFLSYPFAGLSSHVEPYIEAANQLDQIDVLDYGAGIPYGLIYLLRTRPGKVRSITVVDLDLIHAAFSEHVLRSLAPELPITFFKLRDSNSIPDFGSRTFNLLYGKDIFEHLREPERVFRAMLARGGQNCVGFFDLKHHGERYLQHITPDVSYLIDLAGEHSFQFVGRVAGLAAFCRQAAQPKPHSAVEGTPLALPRAEGDLAR